MDEIRINIEETGKQLGIIAAWFSGLVLVWRKGIKPIYMQVRYFQEMIGKLDTVIAELVPNGGSSLRDAVNRIESRQIISDRRSKAFLLDTDVGIWESDANGRCTWWNRTLESMLGRSPDGLNWLLSICKDQREQVQKEWETAVRNKSEYQSELCYVTPEGERTNVIAKGYPLIDEKGEVQGWYGIATRKKDVQ